MKVKKMAAAALVLSSVMALGAVGYAAPAADSVKDIKNNGITFYGGANLVEIPLKDIKSPNKNPFGLVYNGRRSPLRPDAERDKASDRRLRRYDQILQRLVSGLFRRLAKPVTCRRIHGIGSCMDGCLPLSGPD